MAERRIPAQRRTRLSYLLYFWYFLKASLFSTGGTGNLASLHADLLAKHWATNRQFAESLVIGQITPGPTGLWVICLGYLTKGVVGSALAAVAIVIPPFTVLLVERLYSRVHRHPAVEGFMQGLSLAVIGVFSVILVELLRSVGITAATVSVCVIAFLAAGSGRIPIIAIIAAAAATGIALHQIA